MPFRRKIYAGSIPICVTLNTSVSATLRGQMCPIFCYHFWQGDRCCELWTTFLILCQVPRGGAKNINATKIPFSAHGGHYHWYIFCAWRSLITAAKECFGIFSRMLWAPESRMIWILPGLLLNSLSFIISIVRFAWNRNEGTLLYS